MNRMQDAINPSAIRAIQEQNAAIQNALKTSPSIQKAVDNSNGMYAALNALAHRLGQLEINSDAIRAALSSMAYVSSSFQQQQQAFSNLTVKDGRIIHCRTKLDIRKCLAQDNKSLAQDT